MQRPLRSGPLLSNYLEIRKESFSKEHTPYGTNDMYGEYSFFQELIESVNELHMIFRCN